MHGADVCTLLRGDHEKVRELIERIEASDDPDERRRVFEEVAHEVRRHRHAEEEVFYPSLDRAMAEPARERLIAAARAEQARTEAALERVEQVGLDARQSAQALRALKGQVLVHSDMEEYEVFPAVRRSMSDEEMQKVGERLNRWRLETEQLYEGRAKTARRASEP